MSVYKPSGVVWQNFDYYRGITAVTGGANQGTLYLTAMDLPKGFKVTNIYWRSGSTALTRGTSSHYWLAIFDVSRNLLGQSTDDTASAVGANALLTKALATPYITTYSGLFYVGYMIYADTGFGGIQPTVSIFNAPSATIHDQATAGGGAKFNGSSSTGLTNTAPNPAAAITSVAGVPWMGVS